MNSGDVLKSNGDEPNLSTMDTLSISSSDECRLSCLLQVFCFGVEEKRDKGRLRERKKRRFEFPREFPNSNIYSLRSNVFLLFLSQITIQI